jgi:hypothetical protein
MPYIKDEAILKELENLRKQITEIRILLARGFYDQRLPDRADSPNPMGKKRCLSHKLRNGLRDPRIRSMIMDLKKQGLGYLNIETIIKERFPNNPELHVTRSSIHRFHQAALKGRLREYGIEPPF